MRPGRSLVGIIVFGLLVVLLLVAAVIVAIIVLPLLLLFAIWLMAIAAAAQVRGAVERVRRGDAWGSGRRNVRVRIPSDDAAP